MRELIKANATGPPALIKATLTADEIATYTRNVMTNSLAPVNYTPKYVKERIFGVGARPGDVRVLINGFPRDVARWPYFKDAVKDFWTPSLGSPVVVLSADWEVLRERFARRGRAGDEFDKRFDEHDEKIGPIVEAMRQDRMNVFELSANGKLESLFAHFSWEPSSSPFS
jgi:UMP-CMP kinase